MHSLSETLDFTCGQCGRALPFELWLIVDAGERPDLLDRARAGALHTVSCPVCGPQGEVDAPLLLYLPDHNPATGQPPLIFSPAAQTSAEQDQQMAVGLLQELARRLGAAWQNDWLAQVVSVQRALLPVALSDDPLAAMREVLATLADEGADIRSIEELQRVLAERPDLAARLQGVVLDAAREDATPADDLPGSFEASGKVDDDDTASNTLPDLLERFIAAASWDESQRIVEAHPELLSEDADVALGMLVEAANAANDGNSATMFEIHRALLRRCREVGVARAFAERMLPPEGLAEAERLGMTPEEFLAQVRAAHRSEGGAFDIPPDVQPLIAELSRLTQRTDMPRRIELCRQALARIERGANPRLWAALQGELGNSYVQSLQGGRAENIEAA
ncbi:MAG TPA: hypothetical protein DCL15_17280, partial [Chloroflexi bacterium]|nr:hypothetical protein [Chloroflexota bacterium]